MMHASQHGNPLTESPRIQLVTSYPARRRFQGRHQHCRRVLMPRQRYYGTAFILGLALLAGMLTGMLVPLPGTARHAAFLPVLGLLSPGQTMRHRHHGRHRAAISGGS